MQQQRIIGSADKVTRDMAKQLRRETEKPRPKPDVGFFIGLRWAILFAILFYGGLYYLFFA